MGTKHDNSEYENPTSRTGAAPVPQEGVPQAPDAGGDSDAAFREDIRSGLSDAEAQERAEGRAQAERDAASGEADDGELKGQALHDRAKELDIEGRSEMNADELRDAVAKAEQS